MMKTSTIRKVESDSEEGQRRPLRLTTGQEDEAFIDKNTRLQVVAIDGHALTNPPNGSHARPMGQYLLVPGQNDLSGESVASGIFERIRADTDPKYHTLLQK